MASSLGLEQIGLPPSFWEYQVPSRSGTVIPSVGSKGSGMQKPMKLLLGTNDFAKKQKEVDIPKKAGTPMEIDLDGKKR